MIFFCMRSYHDIVSHIYLSSEKFFFALCTLCAWAPRFWFRVAMSLCICPKTLCIIPMFASCLHRSLLRFFSSSYRLNGNGLIIRAEGSSPKNTSIGHFIFPSSFFPNRSTGDLLMILSMASSMDGHCTTDSIQSNNKARAIRRTSLQTRSSVQFDQGQ